MKRHINHLYVHRSNMLPLYGLPGLPETKPKLKGYSVELLAMYITHIYTYRRYSSFTAMLLSLDWEPLESSRFINMCLCIIYKAYYNLAMFPLLEYATPVTVQTRGNNIKFILPHCNKDVFKHCFLQLHSEVGTPYPRWQWRPNPWNFSRPASHVLHTNVTPNCFYPALSGCFVLFCCLNAHFPYYCPFCPSPLNRQY